MPPSAEGTCGFDETQQRRGVVAVATVAVVMQCTVQLLLLLLAELTIDSGRTVSMCVAGTHHGTHVAAALLLPVLFHLCKTSVEYFD
eukprot:COSAG01_NODE_2926_length_6839_cov_5.363353_9_plen_87_part_00